MQRLVILVVIIVFCDLKTSVIAQSSSWQVLYILKFNYMCILILLGTFKESLRTRTSANYIVHFFLRYSCGIFGRIYLIPFLILILLSFLRKSLTNYSYKSLDVLYLLPSPLGYFLNMLKLSVMKLSHLSFLP